MKHLQKSLQTSSE